MDNGLQALLTLLSMLAAVVQLNSAFYNITTAYMHRRQAIIRVICENYTLSALHGTPVLSGMLVWMEIISETMLKYLCGQRLF